MIILGIDPGYAIIGYGAVLYKSHKLYPIGHGAIETSSKLSFNNKLEKIYDSVSLMINKCRPDALSIERLYFNSNQKTAIKVAQARGVILLAAKKTKTSIYEYTPLQVKSAVTGYGHATKNQVMEMTKRLLNLEEVPKPDDTADALAVAICHAQTVDTTLKFKILHNKKGV